MFRAHASISDLEALLSNRYIYQFENGVIVIRHWRMANALRKDRYTPTIFQAELAKLELTDVGEYELVANRLPDGCQVVANCPPQIRLDKNRLDKSREEEKNNTLTLKGSSVCATAKPRKFTPPTFDEVRDYCLERMNNVDPEKFIDFYESKGWMVGKNKMKNWRAAVRTWERAATKPTSEATDRYANLRNLLEANKNE